MAGAIGGAEQGRECDAWPVSGEIAGVNSEIWLHTGWGNPNQQPLHWERPSYERSLPYLLATDADVLTLECASTNGRDLPLPPWVIGLGAFLLLGVLLAVTATFGKDR